jgi:hypothetical protein
VVFVRADQYFQLMTRANAPPQHAVFSGDVNGDGKTDVFFYYGGNGDEWFGISDGTDFQFSRAGNCAGFGNLLDGSHALFTGDFTGDKMTDFAFYYSGNDSVWLGTSTGSALNWSQIGAASNGNWLDGKHRTHVADYDGDGTDDFFVYNQNDGSTWLGITGSSGTALTWYAAGSVGGFGALLDGAHAFLDGDFDGDGKEDVLFYYNGDGSLWLAGSWQIGTSSGAAITWSAGGNTSAHGDLADFSHLILFGSYDGSGKQAPLFYGGGDGNFWMGTSNAAAYTWHVAGNASGFGNLAH